MSSKSSGHQPEKFLAGKGFYIVLFLCAAIIGTSAWMIAAGNETMNASNATQVMSVNEPVKTTVPTPVLPEERAPKINTDGLAPAEESNVPEEEKTVETVVYSWPVSGEVKRSFSDGHLEYDITMEDWRTHNGIDILTEPGTAVTAVRTGRVESIIQDDLYGTMVTLDHGDGMKSVYANLAPDVAAAAGDWINANTVIGTVGSSALCEIAEEPHLHFSLLSGGVYVDPLTYLIG